MKRPVGTQNFWKNALPTASPWACLNGPFGTEGRKFDGLIESLQAFRHNQQDCSKLLSRVSKKQQIERKELAADVLRRLQNAAVVGTLGARC
jgi:hypothetical protein